MCSFELSVGWWHGVSAAGWIGSIIHSYRTINRHKTNVVKSSRQFRVHSQSVSEEKFRRTKLVLTGTKICRRFSTLLVVARLFVILSQLLGGCRNRKFNDAWLRSDIEDKIRILLRLLLRHRPVNLVFVYLQSLTTFQWTTAAVS